MNRRRFLQCAAGLGLAAILPSSAAISQTDTGHAVNKFGHRLLKTLPTDKNLFMSPFSIATALAMTGSGSAGPTLDEFLKLLGFANRQEMIAGFSSLLPQIAAAKSYQMATANGLFVDDTLVLHKAYQQKMEKHFRASIRQLDFDGDPEGSAEQVNDWIENATNQKIKNMLQPNPALRCVLANAVYFKADWTQPFPKDTTRPSPFFLNSGESISVPLMQGQVHSIPYAKGNSFEAVTLPYRGDEVVMNVILPDKGTRIDEIDQRMTGLSFGNQRVRVSMPKYKMETEYGLAKHLADLGLVRAFSDQADFSLLAKEPLKLDTVNHKAFVEVDEQGTEAAGATTVGMLEITSIQPPPIEFRMDRPFLFSLEHKASGAFLFVGRVMDPTV
jgi:serine protease inhibitor